MENLYNETKFIMKKYGITANKALGQNFLISDEVVSSIVSSAEISKNDLVIEIGPGLGTLTKELLEKAGKVVCIELDKKMLTILNDRFSLYQNFMLINDDVLKVDLKSLIKKYVGAGLDQPAGQSSLTPTINNSSTSLITNVKIVANLPYYITTPIIMKLLEEHLDIDTITVMIQKEVADRLTAFPGEKNSGAITYSVYYYARAEKIIDVPNDSFIPEPEVTSSVIKLTLRNSTPVEVKNEEILFKLIKAAFMQRRKTLLNGLYNSNLFSSKNEIKDIFAKLNLDEKVRGENLSLQDFADISNLIK